MTLRYLCREINEQWGRGVQVMEAHLFHGVGFGQIGPNNRGQGGRWRNLSLETLGMHPLGCFEYCGAPTSLTILSGTTRAERIRV
jgi:hypothetical protein